jgi:ribonucleoside-diphosphate reductase alpha chain
MIQLARQGETAIDFAEFTTDWDSDAYLTVSGQNSNNTIRVTDEFLRAVEADGDWVLTARLDGAPVKVMKARDLWHKIGRAAWACADAVSHNDQRLAHLPGRGSDRRVEPVLGIYVPR